MSGNEKRPCPTCGLTTTYGWCGRCGTSVGPESRRPIVPVAIDELNRLARDYRNDERIYGLLRRYGLLDCIGKAEGISEGT